MQDSGPFEITGPFDGITLGGDTTMKKLINDPADVVAQNAVPSVQRANGTRLDRPFEMQVQFGFGKIAKKICGSGRHGYSLSGRETKKDNAAHPGDSQRIRADKSLRN